MSAIDDSSVEAQIKQENSPLEPRSKKELEHEVQTSRLEIAKISVIVCLCLLAGIFILLFIVDILPYADKGDGLETLADRGVQGLFAVLTLILGYVAGSSASK